MPQIKKIGTANPFVEIENYPSAQIIKIDDTNFFEENPSYDEFYNYAGSDDSGRPSNVGSLMRKTWLSIEDLLMLESLHLYQSALRGVSKSNCPKLKKLFYFKKRYNFIDDTWLFDSKLREFDVTTKPNIAV